MTWELATANRFTLSALQYCGELRSTLRLVPTLLLAAVQQGNLFAATDRRTRINLIWLAMDDPDRALIRASLTHQRGQKDEARLHLSRAAENFAGADMHLYAAAAKRRLGQVLNNERGLELVSEADAWMRDQRVRNPERLARMLAPGFVGLDDELSRTS